MSRSEFPSKGLVPIIGVALAVCSCTTTVVDKGTPDKAPGKNLPKREAGQKPKHDQKKVAEPVVSGTPDELRARQAGLIVRKTAIAAKIGEIEKRIDGLPEIADLREKSDAARKEMDEKRASNPASIAARDAERKAQAALEQKVREIVSAGPEAKALASFDAENADAKRDLNYRTGLLKMQIQHALVDAVAQIENDPKVKDAASALAKAEKQLHDGVASELAKARASSAAARAAFAAVEAKIRESAAVVRASEKLRQAQDALREAEKADPRREALEKARKACDEARSSAYAELADAKALLKEVADVEKAVQSLKAEQRALQQMLSVSRNAALENAGPAVQKSREALKRAQAAYDKELLRDELAPLKKELDKARQDFEMQSDAMFGKNPEYVALDKKREVAAGKLAVLEKSSASVSSEKDARSIAAKMAALNEEIAGIEASKRHIRITTGGTKWDKVYRAGGQAERALNEKIARIAEPANTAREKAEDLLEEAVRKQAEESAPGIVIDKALDAVVAELSLLHRRLQVAKYQLYNANSPLCVAVEKSPSVVKARDAVRDAETAMREKGPRELESALKARDDARANYESVMSKLRQSEDCMNAATAVAASESVLRDAEKKDAVLKTVENAKRALEATREAVGQAQPDVAKLTGEMKTLDARDKELRDARTKLLDAIKSAAQKTGDSDNKDVAMMKKEVDHARKNVAAAQQSDEVTAAVRKYESAKALCDAKRKDALAADAEYNRLKGELDKVGQELHGIEKALRKVKEG